MATVRLPSVLRPYAGGERELEVDAASLRSLLDDVRERFPRWSGGCAMRAGGCAGT